MLRERGAHRLPRIVSAAGIRFTGSRQDAASSYAELARIGRVSRARVTQIMDLLNLPPHMLERLLLMPTSLPFRRDFKWFAQ